MAFTWYEPDGMAVVENVYVPSPSGSCSHDRMQSGAQSPGQPSSDWNEPGAVTIGPSVSVVMWCVRWS